MPHFVPFKGILYNPDKVSFDSVVSPPYDIISPSRRNELYASNEYNFVKLDFPQEENKYEIAAKRFEEWRDSQVFVQDDSSGFYILEQHFTSDYKSFTRRGIIGLCRLEELQEHASIHRHEKTYPKPKEDRLNLLSTTNTHFSQVFGIFSDPERFTMEEMEHLCSKKYFTEFTFENVRTRLWKISEPSFIDYVHIALSTLQVVIADGHHRYETALAFQNLMKTRNPDHTGEEGYNYVMMYLTNAVSDGLCILPTHRILRSDRIDIPSFIQQAERYFSIASYFSLPKLMEGLKKYKRFAFGIFPKNSSVMYLLHLKEEKIIRDLLHKLPANLQRLDVSLLHQFIFEQLLQLSSEEQQNRSILDFETDLKKIYNIIMKGEANAAFLMNPTYVDQVFNTAICGSTMPQKSTYFYPKLPSGTVLFDTKKF